MTPLRGSVWTTTDFLTTDYWLLILRYGRIHHLWRLGIIRLLRLRLFLRRLFGLRRDLARRLLLLLALHLLQLFQQLLGGLGLLLTLRRLLLLLLLILSGNRLIRNLLRGRFHLIFRYFGRWLGLRLIEYRLRGGASGQCGRRAFFVQQNELHQ